MVDKIIVLDFGSQYNQLICRRIREMGVYSELLSYDTDINKLKDDSIKGIIFSGGPNSVYDENAFKIDPEIFELNKPILGICYGMQLIAFMNNGNVKSSQKKEYGHTILNVDNNSLLFKGLDLQEQVWMSHGDSVTSIDNDFKVIATNESTPIAAIENTKRNIYGVQFHLEVNDTLNGNKMLHNFVFDICKAKNNWSMDEFINVQVKNIQEKVKGDNVICGLSGGVDSSVVAALLSKAIGKQLTCIFVNHGLLRKNEVEEVVENFNSQFQMNLVVVDARERFLNRLKGVSDPETKRKIIGEEFINVFYEEAKKVDNAKYLAQGTLYTDIIESGTKTAKTIKSHHNVGGLPKDLKFSLIEPLNTLFKDEVRELGRKLHLKDNIVNKQPFPGPGLAIRVIGEITEEKLRIVRDSDYILREEIKKAHLDTKIWQYFTALLNNRSVGVMGDNRSYEYTIAIRAVNSIDGMTASFYPIDFNVLQIISTRIVNEVVGVNRVMYDITNKPPATIEYE